MINPRGGISQEGQKCTFRVKSLHLFVELEWHFTARARNVHLKLKTSTFLRISVKRLGLIYVVAFHRKGQKCTFRVTNLHIVVDLE